MKVDSNASPVVRRQANFSPIEHQRQAKTLFFPLTSFSQIKRRLTSRGFRSEMPTSQMKVKTGVRSSESRSSSTRRAASAKDHVYA